MEYMYSTLFLLLSYVLFGAHIYFDSLERKHYKINSKEAKKYFIIKLVILTSSGISFGLAMYCIDHG